MIETRPVLGAFGASVGSTGVPIFGASVCRRSGCDSAGAASRAGWSEAWPVPERSRRRRPAQASGQAQRSPCPPARPVPSCPPAWANRHTSAKRGWCDPPVSRERLGSAANLRRRALLRWAETCVGLHASGCEMTSYFAKFQTLRGSVRGRASYLERNAAAFHKLNARKSRLGRC